MNTNTSLELTVRAQTKVAELRDKVVERFENQDGQTAAEYLGVLVVIVVIIGTLVAAGIDHKIADLINKTIDKVGAGNGR